MGHHAALEKIGQPLMSALLKQRLAGGAAGAGLGALAGGEEHRLSGALGGGLLGALGGQALGKSMQRHTQKEVGAGIRSGIEAAGGSRAARSAAGRRLSGEARPMIERSRELAFPTPSRVMG
jgi:hypothetical protein